MAEHVMAESFMQRLRRNPWKLFWSLVPIIATRLGEHRACAWANDRIDAGAGPMIHWIRDVLMASIDHPVLSVVAITALFCLGLVLFTFVSTWIKAWKETIRQKPELSTAVDRHLKTLDILSDDHGTKLENLLTRITALENSLVASEQVFRDLPLFVRGCV